MMLPVHQLLIFHQNPHHLCQRCDLAVLHADDAQQLEHHQYQKHRHAQQHHRGLLDVRRRGENLNPVRPDRQHQERKPQQQKQQGIPLLQLELLEPANRQQQQRSAEEHQDQAANHREPPWD